jgi:hypothetical protein
MAGKLGSYEAVRSKDLSYSRVELTEITGKSRLIVRTK